MNVPDTASSQACLLCGEHSSLFLTSREKGSEFSFHSQRHQSLYFPNKGHLIWEGRELDVLLWHYGCEVRVTAQKNPVLGITLCVCQF